MSDLREIGNFDLRDGGPLPAEANPGDDSVLDLVYEIGPDGVDGDPQSRFTYPDGRASGNSMLVQRWPRDELLLDQELDPVEDPVEAEAVPETPYIMVSLPGGSYSSNIPGTSGRIHPIYRPDSSGRRTASLADLLDQARALASAARVSEGRSRVALYRAIECAYEVALTARVNPEELTRLADAAQIRLSEKTPAVAIVKLVFGAGYDKTRVSEFATVLSHAQRIELGSGRLASYLSRSSGGLKGVVAEERRLRIAHTGTARPVRTGPSNSLARKLRSMELRPMQAISRDGDEFVLVLARRLPDGTAAMIGEVPRDIALLERAARRLASSQD